MPEALFENTLSTSNVDWLQTRKNRLGFLGEHIAKKRTGSYQIVGFQIVHSIIHDTTIAVDFPPRSDRSSWLSREPLTA